MADKHDYLFRNKGDGIEGMARELATFSAFGEGLQLFASFVMLLNFQRFGKMKKVLYSFNVCRMFWLY